MATPRFPSPSQAYIPGQTPRHSETAFAQLRGSVIPGMAARDLARCDAWLAGWQFLDDGFAWEAHEVWEPVWMALPVGSDERRMVQAAIQVANAALKLKMDRPRAALRLCGLADNLVHDIGANPVMGVQGEALRAMTRRLRTTANLQTGGHEDAR